jgi:hypothetical protein
VTLLELHDEVVRLVEAGYGQFEIRLGGWFGGYPTLEVWADDELIIAREPSCF